MNYLTAPFKWLYNRWLQFNHWVSTIAPGLKTKVISALGFIGTTAALLQEKITELPLAHFVSDTEIAGITLILFALSFWFRALAKD